MESEHQIRTQPRGWHGRLSVKVAPREGQVFCNDCQTFKGVDHFQKRNGRPLSPCVACRAKRCQKYVADGHRNYPGSSEDRRQQIYAWAARNKEKRAAHQAVQYALRKGKLKRLPCESCGEPKSHAHHRDYSQKLDVQWLCVVCHKKEHRKYV